MVTYYNENHHLSPVIISKGTGLSQQVAEQHIFNAQHRYVYQGILTKRLTKRLELLLLRH